MRIVLLAFVLSGCVVEVRCPCAVPAAAHKPAPVKEYVIGGDGVDGF